MRPILSDVHGLSVCLLVCLSLVTRMYCGKTAGPIEMRLSSGVGWATVTMYQMVFRIPPQEGAILGWGRAVPY